MGLRAGWGCCGIDGGCLHFVLLIVHFTRSLKWTDLAFFLKLLWGKVGCGLMRSMRPWKVMLLVVFLKLPGVGEVGTVRQLCVSGPQGLGP